ncbi:MAG: hypothetical protein QM581_07100 [Pseudomonas sp.]
MDIRLGQPTDIYNLISINHKWQRHLLNNNKNGFLSASFDFPTFDTLINNGEIVVAYNDLILAGYYLINNYSQDGVLKIHKQIVDSLKTKEVIPHNSKVGLGAQALVDIEYQGTGLRSLMLNELTLALKNKFDFLFSTISKENPRAFKGHTKDGWIVVEEDENVYSVILKV